MINRPKFPARPANPVSDRPYRLMASRSVTGTTWKPRDALKKLVISQGGSFSCSVTKRTDILVLGAGGQGARRQQQASELVEKGEDIKIIGEDDLNQQFASSTESSEASLTEAEVFGIFSLDLGMTVMADFNLHPTSKTEFALKALGQISTESRT